MSNFDSDAVNKGDGAKPESRERSRVLRYDEVRTSQVRLIKSVKSDAKKQNSRKAILRVRRLMDDNGVHIRTEVDIQSKRISQVIQEINTDVEGISPNRNPPVVPLELFFHNFLALQERLDTARHSEPRDEELISDLAETVMFAKSEHAINMDNLERLVDAGEITWDLMWAIFPPNILVYRYHRLTEQDQVLKLRAMSQVKRQDNSIFWRLECHIVADDGIKFGLASEPMVAVIDQFTGARKIADLRVFPLKYHEKMSDVRATALDRGRRLATFREPQVIETSGSAMFENRTNRWEAYQFPSHGRIIIDVAGFRSVNPNITFLPEVHAKLRRESLTEEQLIISTPVMLGFCFSNSRWGAFAMSRLVDVEWNHEAFEDLVLEAPTKVLVRSLVKQHSSQGDGLDDIVSGKGKGIICLFSGPPGSGKTLTAEAVAEITRKPLYSVSAGDLGIRPTDVDQKLSEIMELSRKWNSVLLLDEADVFLQKRDSADIQRNALVSIFLRQLEYYQGILILTTNRASECDAAFESRIHIPIVYPELDESARRKIWATFLRKIKDTPHGATVEITEEDISRLAKMEINGRKIKNIFSSARIVAREMDEMLSISHIDIVLNATKSGFKAIDPR
ncbi:putative inactive ATP-dependent zinc metalloprotease FTSHI 3 [Colletotrichum gloeosporioides]|uniref:Putative inactive ATP-dependent zinc metalloprotease FTSHI 3 n=1 Tax=Colletotrichum gloeosporioides TaxID=474922 RepID=A0A8H4CDE4_COLGL|nr:putative inactive ATP-dependent zinc metalloprotease FTSHI 3 [Colletotrichum gloeosporioides]KAF3801960.1 putative inactive ATP-dependent zinc metalloprotease FTSHI 3 [Colletotrichum gloeosporioides]